MRWRPGATSGLTCPGLVTRGLCCGPGFVGPVRSGPRMSIAGPGSPNISTRCPASRDAALSAHVSCAPIQASSRWGTKRGQWRAVTCHDRIEISPYRTFRRIAFAQGQVLRRLLRALSSRARLRGRRSWAQRLTVRGRRYTRGLGSYPVVSLNEARAAAFENARAVAAGNGLVQQPDERAPTLREAAEKTVEILRPRWTDPRRPRLWLRSLELYVISALGAHRVSDIRSRELLEVLVPLFERIPDTGGRVRQRVRAVMNWAIAQGYRTDNPAGVVHSTMLPAGASRPLHFRTLPHAKVGDELVTIRASGAHPSTKLALELLVLTATRSGEIWGVRVAAAIASDWDFGRCSRDEAAGVAPEREVEGGIAFATPCRSRDHGVSAWGTDRSPGRNHGTQSPTTRRADHARIHHRTDHVPLTK